MNRRQRQSTPMERSLQMPNPPPNIQANACQRSGVSNISFTVVQLFIGVCLINTIAALTHAIRWELQSGKEFAYIFLLVFLFLFLIKYFVDDLMINQRGNESPSWAKSFFLMLAWSSFYSATKTMSKIECFSAVSSQIPFIVTPAIFSLIVFSSLVTFADSGKTILFVVSENICLTVALVCLACPSTYSTLFLCITLILFLSITTIEVVLNAHEKRTKGACHGC